MVCAMRSANAVFRFLVMSTTYPISNMHTSSCLNVYLYLHHVASMSFRLQVDFAGYAQHMVGVSSHLIFGHSMVLCCERSLSCKSCMLDASQAVGVACRQASASKTRPSPWTLEPAFEQHSYSGDFRRQDSTTASVHGMRITRRKAAARYCWTRTYTLYVHRLNLM